MSLQPSPIPPIPDETARVAHAAFPRGNTYLRLREELGPLYEDSVTEPVKLGVSEPVYERGKVKRAGAESGVESSRTSPSPSASVDLAPLRPHPRSRFVHSRHTSPEPEAKGESPSASSIHHEPMPA